jgi:hypothetical protein
MLLSLFSSKRCGFVTVRSRAADLEQLSALESGSVRGKLAVRICEYAQ